MAKKKRLVVRFLHHGELLQLVLVGLLVHFVSKDLNILENVVVVKVCLKQ